MHKNEERFLQKLKDIAELRARKSHDYSAAQDPFNNLKMCEVAGIPAWQGVAIRIGDKLSRIMSFMKQGECKVKDEAIQDTFLDLAVYGIIGACLFEEWTDGQKTDTPKSVITE